MPAATDFAGARLEDIVVVDQNNVVRLWINASGTDNYPKVNQMVDALLNQTPVISLSLRQVYFGTKANAGESKTANLDITNTGDGPLEITGYTAPTDVVIEPATFTIAKNETKTVKIILTPTQTGTFSGTVELKHNNASVEKLEIPILQLTIEGKVSPSIVLAQESLSFGQIELNKSVQKTITIRNDGPGVLNVSNITTTLTDINISSTQFTVAAGASKDITITYTPKTESTLAGIINIISDDPTKGTLNISLSGTAIFIPANPRADFDGSGIVDFPDFLGFARAFGSTNLTYDLNDNGIVDFPDFLSFAQSFGKSVN